MENNRSKRKLLFIRGSLTKTINNVKLEGTNAQKQSGLMITLAFTGLTTPTDVFKKNRDILQLKRNISCDRSRINKLHLYTDYVFPIIQFCSQAWPTNIKTLGNLKKYKKWQQIRSSPL